MITLFESENHKNVFFNDLSSGHMVQANEHIIIDDDEGIVLDPGGHKVHSKLFSLISKVLSINKIKHIFFSHQDPDIIAAANAWLMVTDANAYLSKLWMRFIPHFGVDKFVINRIIPIPDDGMTINLNGKPLKVIPAHYLHSAGNFQLYDQTAKILYTGDLGASFGQNYDVVKNFDTHVQYMEGFHKRYIPSNKISKMWVNMVKTLDIEIMAPQHGAIIPDREMVSKFLNWLYNLPCGSDIMSDNFSFPV